MTWKRLLVPLDGSRLAEAALPPAASIAERLSAAVTLLHVVEPDAPSQVHGERHLTTPEDACAYLAEVARSAMPPTVPVERHWHPVASGDVARILAEEAVEAGADLVVMCTHGSGGLRRMLFGSIAQQLLALERLPVLLIRPEPGAENWPFTCTRILVPLDGKPEHDQGLPAAAMLAAAFGAALHLLIVVPTLRTLAGEQAATGVLLPRTTAAMLDLQQQDAATYLAQCIKALQQQGLTATGEVNRGDPSDRIVRVARRVDPDLVVLGTHGRSGADAFWSGSIAPRVSHRVRRPLLLVPLHQSPPAE